MISYWSAPPFVPQKNLFYGIFHHFSNSGDDGQDDDVITVNHSGDLIPLEHLDNGDLRAAEEEREDEEEGEEKKEKSDAGHLLIEDNAIRNSDVVNFDSNEGDGENPDPVFQNSYESR